MEEKMLLSVGDASLILRVSERQVRRYCNEGKLVCRKDGKAFEIEYDSMLEFLKSNTTPVLDEDIASDEEETDADIAADVRNDEANVRKPASEKASTPPKREKPAQNSDSLSDISVLSDRLQKAVEAARTSQKELADTAHLMLKRLSFERQHNQEIESCLQEVLTGPRTGHKKLRKMSRRFMALLPWILFWIAAGVALLPWI